MKRLQCIEFNYQTTNINTLMKRIQKKNNNFYEIWGETVENLFNQDGDYNTIDERENGGFFIGVSKQEYSTYVWFIAYDENQIIK